MTTIQGVVVVLLLGASSLVSAADAKCQAAAKPAAQMVMFANAKPGKDPDPSKLPTVEKEWVTVCEAAGGGSKHGSALDCYAKATKPNGDARLSAFDKCPEQPFKGWSEQIGAKLK